VNGRRWETPTGVDSELAPVCTDVEDGANVARQWNYVVLDRCRNAVAQGTAVGLAAN
jgi:hypothetical protein